MELDLWFIAFIFSGPFPHICSFPHCVPLTKNAQFHIQCLAEPYHPLEAFSDHPRALPLLSLKFYSTEVCSLIWLLIYCFFLWAIWELSGWRPRLVFFWVPQWLNLFSINVSSLLMANPLKICESNFGGGQRDSMKKYVESFYKSMMLLLLYLYKNKKYHEYYNGTLLPLLLLALLLLLLISNKILQVKHNGLSRIFQWICGTRGLLNGGGESRKRGEVWKGRRKVKGVGLME